MLASLEPLTGAVIRIQTANTCPVWLYSGH